MVSLLGYLYPREIFNVFKEINGENETYQELCLFAKVFESMKGGQSYFIYDIKENGR